jgi:CheY-like chemotaxis protein
MKPSILNTVLVLDDDPVFAFELGGSLRGAGYTVVGAAKGAEAYELLLSQNIDLAIVDLNLPDMSGLKFIHEARRLSKPVKIVATTGTRTDRELEIAEFMGADLAVRKFAGIRGDEFADGEWVEVVRRVLAQ